MELLIALVILIMLSMFVLVIASFKDMESPKDEE